MACAVSGIRSAAACTRTIAVITTAPRVGRLHGCTLVHARSSTGRGCGSRPHPPPACPPRRRAVPAQRRLRRAPAGCRRVVSQRCSSRTSSAGAPRSGPGPGSTVCGAGAQRVDHRHRRHAPARRPRRRRAGRGAPPRAPSRRARPGRAPTTSAQRPRARPAAGRDRAPTTRPASRSRTAGGRLEPLPPGERRRPASARACSGVVVRGRRPARRQADDGGGVLRRRLQPGARGGAAAAARAGRTGRRGAPRAGMRCVHGRRGTASSTVSTAAARVVPRAERAQRAVARCRHHRQPRERLRGGRDPPRRVRVAGAAVVAGPVRRDQPQLAHRRPPGRARRRRCRPARPERHHVAHAPAALARGEVAAHPPPQVAAGADVEHLVAGTAEQVHPGRGRHRLGQVALVPLALRRPVRRRVARPARAAPRGSARPRLPIRSSRRWSTSTVARASASARCVGRVEVPNSSGQRAQPHAGRLVAATARRGPGARCRARAGAATRARAARTRRAGTRRRTGALCATSTRAARGTRAPTAAPAAAAARR